MPCKGSPLARQRGFAMVAFVVALGAIALVIVAGYASQATRDADGRIDRDREAWLEAAEAKLKARYFSNATDMVSADDGVSQAVLLSRAGVVPRWDAGLFVSKVLTDGPGGVHYTSMVLWLPGFHDRSPPPSFDPATGEFKVCPAGGCPGRPFRIVSGVGAQREALEATSKTLGVLAAKAEVFAKAYMLQDPEHDLSRNPFRIGDCWSVETRRPPCIIGSVPLFSASAGGTAALFGISPSEAVDGWGQPILVNNEEGAAVIDPPYFLKFSATPPWGAPVTSIAAQPL